MPSPHFTPSPSVPAVEAALPDVPFDDISSFTRKLIHDVRNGLNALDLQLASILDMAEESESGLVDDVKMARRLLNDEARRLTQLSAQFRSGTSEVIDYHAADLVEDLRERIERMLREAAPLIDWDLRLADVRVSIDFEVVSLAVIELLRNALHFRENGSRIGVRAAREDSSFVIELAEPHATVEGEPEQWGHLPFRSTRRGAYGLGLFSTRRALGSIGGHLHHRHDKASGILFSRITLPLATVGA